MQTARCGVHDGCGNLMVVVSDRVVTPWFATTRYERGLTSVRHSWWTRGYERARLSVARGGLVGTNYECGRRLSVARGGLVGTEYSVDSWVR